MPKTVQKTGFVLLAIAMIVGSFLFHSCKKDPCANTQCLNGGICTDGTCSCPTGYSGPNCATKDPCLGVTCRNGGYCANGTCNCPTGYSGSDCGIEVTPASVTITKMVLEKFPATDPNGAGWDPSSGADIFMTINPGTTSTTTTFKTGYYTDANANLSYTFDNVNYTISSINSNWTIGLWDYDTIDPDDFMAGYYIKPIDMKSGFPKSYTIYNSTYLNGNFKVTLYLQWNF